MLEKIPIKTSSDPRNKIIINDNFYKNVKIKIEKTLISRETPCFPSDETLSEFASAVYQDHPDPLPEGWTLLTTAANESDGYFGAAFWHFASQQLVIAHRGTQDLKALVADVEGVVRTCFTPQMNSACTFVAHLLKQLPEAEKILISMTGHSLGAWLAQVTAFSLQFLTIKDQKFRSKNEGEFQFHAHVVGFESPGCRPMLTKLAEHFHFRYKTHPESLLKKLDITNYLTLPNRINCCNKHVGNLRQIVIEKPENENFKFFEYLQYYHSMENIRDAMNNYDKNDEKVRGTKGRRLKIDDWPCTFWPERAVSSRKLPIKLLNNLYNCALVAFDMVISSNNTSELITFYKNLEDELDRDITYGIMVHFKVSKIDEFARKTNIFNEIELTFLSNWFKLKEQNIDFSREFQSLNLDLLPEYFFEENEEKIRCNSEGEVKKVINLIKFLFRSLSLSEAIELNKKLVEMLKTSFGICRKESENFIKEINDNELQFKDMIGLERFLGSSNNEQIFVLKCAERSILEMSRILSILNRSDVKNYLFLNWEQIVRLSNLIYLEKTFNSKTEYLIVLGCQNCSREMNGNEENIMKSLIESLKSKLILVVSSESRILELVDKTSKKIVVESSFKFSNLLSKSQKFLNHKIINLNDGSYELNELVDEEGKENLSLTTIEILSRNEVNIGQFHLKTCANFNISIQLNEPVEHSIFFDSLKDDLVILISSSNINSSLTEELMEIFDREKMEKLKHFQEREKVKICSEKDESRISETFDNLCKNSKNDSKIFWLELIFPRLILKQIYHRDLYTPTELSKNTKLNNKIFEFIAKNENPGILFIFGNHIEEPLNPNEQGANKKKLFKYFDLDSILTNSLKNQFLSKMNNSIFCCAENDVEIEFNRLVSSNSDKCVHWLNLFSKSEVYWQKSHGSIQCLDQYLDKRFVIICDEPGMGKSTSLSKFGKELSGWVINLDLASHQRELLSLNIRNLADILNLMVETMNLEPKDLFSEILSCSLKNPKFQKINFLFDGFDELDKCAREKMLIILNILKVESSANIWITTRPDQKKVLEDCLSVPSSKFVKFDREKQSEFLIKFWKSCLHFHRYNESLLDKYANEVLNEAQNILGADIPEFLGNPLHMRMVAEVVWPLLKRRIGSNCDSLELGNNFKSRDFFREFVKIKYESYEKRQNLRNCDNFVRYSVSFMLRKHFRELALRMLFPFEARNTFGVESSIDMDQLMTGLVRVGLVHTVNRQHQFIYRVLSEYFVADFLFYWLKKFRNQHGNYETATNFVINTVLLEKEHRTIREFINYALLIDFDTYANVLCID